MLKYETNGNSKINKIFQRKLITHLYQFWLMQYNEAIVHIPTDSANPEESIGAININVN